MRDLTRLFPASLAFLVSGLVFAHPALAVSLADIAELKKPNIRWGQLELHPYYTFSEMYDSNVYLLPRDQPNGFRVGNGVRGSWITRNTVGLDLKLPVGPLHKFQGGYEFRSANYSTQSNANDTTGQTANLVYQYRGPHNIGATAADAYINTTDPAFLELIQRQLRWQNNFQTLLNYAPENGRLNGAVDYSDTVNKYLNPTLAAVLNNNDQRFGAKLGCKVQPKTNAYVAYHRELIHYPIPSALDKDSKAHQIDGGIEGILLSKLTGQIQTGMAYRQYDSARPGSATRITRNWTVGTGLTYKPVNRTQIDLTLTRSLQDSIDGIDRFYIANDASLIAAHKLPHKFTVGLMLAMSIDKYSETQTQGGLTAVRRDDIYQEGAALDYDIREWLTAGIKYLHRERDSIFGGQFNYDDHQTSVSLALKF